MLRLGFDLTPATKAILAPRLRLAEMLTGTLIVTLIGTLIVTLTGTLIAAP